MKNIPALLIAISLLASCTKSEIPIHFMHLLNRSQMLFIEPNGYVRMDSIPNNAMNCDLGYRHKRDKIEVRYAIRPMDNLLTAYDKHQEKNDSSIVLIHPNKLYHKAFKDSLLKISGGEFPNYNIFSPSAIKIEFNATWGASALVEVGKDCKLNYTYCYIIFIHKNDIGNALILFLSDDIKLINRELMKLIHNLKFSH